MKTIKLLLAVTMVLAFNLSNAQSLITNEVDEFTGSTKKMTKTYNIAEGKGYLIKATAIKIDNLYAIYISSNADLGCAGSSDNYVIFKFVDATTIKLKDVSSIDCKDEAPSTFIIKKDDLYKFDKAIDKIRFKQSNLYLDANTTGTYSVSQLIKAVK